MGEPLVIAAAAVAGLAIVAVLVWRRGAMSKTVERLVTIATAVIGITIIAVLVSKRPNRPPIE